LHFIAINPSFTDVKFFLASEDGVYGMCNSAKYHCIWHVGTKRITYVTNSEYATSQSNMNLVSTSVLDDIDMDVNVEATDDPSIGSTSFISRSLFSNKGGCDINTDYVKIPIFFDFIDNFPRFPYHISRFYVN